MFFLHLRWKQNFDEKNLIRLQDQEAERADFLCFLNRGENFHNILLIYSSLLRGNFRRKSFRQCSTMFHKTSVQIHSADFL